MIDFQLIRQISIIQLNYLIRNGLESLLLGSVIESLL